MDMPDSIVLLRESLDYIKVWISKDMTHGRRQAVAGSFGIRMGEGQGSGEVIGMDHAGSSGRGGLVIPVGFQTIVIDVGHGDIGTGGIGGRERRGTGAEGGKFSRLIGVFQLCKQFSNFDTRTKFCHVRFSFAVQKAANFWTALLCVPVIWLYLLRRFRVVSATSHCQTPHPLCGGYCWQQRIDSHHPASLRSP